MKDVIAVLKEQRSELVHNIERIDAAISALGGKAGRSAAADRGARKRRAMSADAKRAVSERMKNYWAERRKQAEAAAAKDAKAPRTTRAAASKG